MPDYLKKGSRFVSEYEYNQYSLIIRDKEHWRALKTKALSIYGDKLKIRKGKRKFCTMIDLDRVDDQGNPIKKKQRQIAGSGGGESSV